MPEYHWFVNQAHCFNQLQQAYGCLLIWYSHQQKRPALSRESETIGITITLKLSVLLLAEERVVLHPLSNAHTYTRCQEP